MQQQTFSPLILTLELNDPDIIAELVKYPEGPERTSFATAALRLGILSLRFAAGQLDSVAIKEVGNSLIAEIREVLQARGSEVSNEIINALRQYFHPDTGSLPQRINTLIKVDGDLDNRLLAHLAPSNSTLAQLLDNTLQEQRNILLREFSLDNKDSALSRLVAELTINQTQLSSSVKADIDAVIKEFSLDQPNSALSRLVARVEATQRTINEQFSTDSETSAISKLSRLLNNTSNQITNSLTLDDENSALSRLKREIQAVLDSIIQSNNLFQTDVKASLAALNARRQEEQRSTRHGSIFENDLGTLLTIEAQRFNDIHQAIGNTSGTIRNCKTGDHIVLLGPESFAPGVRIVWEAKEDKSYDLKRALTEIEEARKNRQAQIGVFVFSSKTVPENTQPFARYNNDLVVVWDSEDPITDLYIKAAYSVSRALTIRQSHEVKETEEAFTQIELATRQIEKQIQYMDEFKRMGETVKGHGEKIIDRAERVKKELLTEVERLDKHLHSLRTNTDIITDSSIF